MGLSLRTLLLFCVPFVLCSFFRLSSPDFGVKDFFQTPNFSPLLACFTSFPTDAPFLLQDLAHWDAELHEGPRPSGFGMDSTHLVFLLSGPHLQGQDRAHSIPKFCAPAPRSASTNVKTLKQAMTSAFKSQLTLVFFKYRSMCNCAE